MEAAVQSVKMGDVRVLVTQGRMLGIYVITNTASGKQYVGSAVNIQNRLQKHRWDLKKGIHHSQKLQRAWDKYGESEFSFAVLLLCEPAKLLSYEQIILDKFDTANNGYNVLRTAGSRFGMTHSAETKAKMSAAATGRKMSEKAIEKMRERMIGYSPSAATRLKISMSSKGKKASPEAIANMKGHFVSAETRAKIGAALKGRTHTPEAIEKMRNAKKSFKQTEEAKKQISESVKALRAKQRLAKAGEAS